MSAPLTVGAFLWIMVYREDNGVSRNRDTIASIRVHGDRTCPLGNITARNAAARNVAPIGKIRMQKQERFAPVFWLKINFAPTQTSDHATGVLGGLAGNSLTGLPAPVNSELRRAASALRRLRQSPGAHPVRFVSRYSFVRSPHAGACTLILGQPAMKLSTWLQMASKVSLLMSCSMLQASSSAVS